MNTIRFFIIAVLSVLFSIVSGQNSTVRCLLPSKIMDEIIGEASGERAMNHIIEMGGYIHIRPDSEYTGNFSETQYVMSKIKEYGLAGAKINTYPARGVWRGISGNLWEVSPGKSKLADYEDLPAMLAQGSVTNDVTALLVWVGEGSVADIEKVDVKGKIVFTSGNVGSVHNLSIAKGAVGVISYDSPRPLVDPIGIPYAGISGGKLGNESVKPAFAFYLPPREGYLLRNRLVRGDQITVHAAVQAKTLDSDLEVTECIIPGTNPDAGEIIFSAHLFEGFVKQGANDNISGAAALLEIARMFKTMIDEGRLAQPLRTIRFIFVPEFSGTGKWTMENKTLMAKTLCNINLDMVGLHLRASQSFLCMHRTTYGNPHYVNDVMENFFKYVGSGNISTLGKGAFTKRIVSPTGSDDPFYYAILDHAGGSDHEVFNDWGVQVPGIMMITWPDKYYHTSEDLANKCDATELKRVAVIGAAAAYTIANADNQMTMMIAGEVTGNGSGRIGRQLIRAMDELKQADKASFEKVYLKTRGYIEAAIINEKATILSTKELITGTQTDAYLNAQVTSIEIAGGAALKSFDQFMVAMASGFATAPVVKKLTMLEKQAIKMKPVTTPKVTELGYLKYSDVIKEIPVPTLEKYPVINQKIDRNEVGRLCNGVNSILDIKKLIDAQTGDDNELQDVINLVSIFSEAGLVKL